MRLALSPMTDRHFARRSIPCHAVAAPLDYEFRYNSRQSCYEFFGVAVVLAYQTDL